MKRDDLPFRYFIAGIPEALTEASNMWDHPFVEALPNCDTGPSRGATRHDASALKLHEYFNAAQAFITSTVLDRFEEDDTTQNIAPSTQKTEEGLPPFEQIRQVDIFLEKHGIFYHPARVEVTLKNGYNSHVRPPDTTKSEGLGSSKHEDFHTKQHFVLNTAISPQGLALIHREYALLQQLGAPSHHRNGVGQKFLPRVFGAKSHFCRGMEIAFLLGEWFEGFHEFHLTDSPPRIQTTKPSISGRATVVSLPTHRPIISRFMRRLPRF